MGVQSRAKVDSAALHIVKVRLLVSQFKVGTLNILTRYKLHYTTTRATYG